MVAERSPQWPDPGVPDAPGSPRGVSNEAFRAAMSHVAGGVSVISADWQQSAHAMTATAFCSVSLEPPLVLVSVSKTSRFHRAITSAGRWAISVLREDQEEIARHFATPGRDLATQFDGVDHRPAPVSGAPLINGSLVWMDCETYAAHEAGDHTIMVGLVLATGRQLDDPAEGAAIPVGIGPLVYYRGRYRRR